MSPGKDVTVCLKRLSLFLRLPYNFGIWSSEVSDWIPCWRKRKDSHTWAQQVSDRMDYGLTITFPVFKWDHQNFSHTNKSSCFHINIGWSDFFITKPSTCQTLFWGWIKSIRVWSCTAFHLPCLSMYWLICTDQIPPAILNRTFRKSPVSRICSWNNTAHPMVTRAVLL